MSLHVLYSTLSAFEIALGILTLLLIVRARASKTYWTMMIVTSWQVIPYLTLVYMQHLGPDRISRQAAYIIYFYTYWAAFGVQAISALLLTFFVLNEAMRPLKGLQRLGYIVYFWAGGVSVALAASAAVMPKFAGGMFVADVVSQLQRASGIITFSLIMFVCLAIKPIGLTLRSRVFGLGVGLLIVSATNTLQANYFMHPRGLYGHYALVQISANCLANLIWAYYFFVPEPERRFVLLPTTSPFHHWNRISELLGQEPGYVAIGGVPPESFSGAEIDIFRRASAKMKELEDQQNQPALTVR